ncbi:MAG: hypothetical protein OSB41_05590 [Kiritimatiellae bacterium]|nr:hypothetical protein [Kiritimatiellia bacterium]
MRIDGKIATIILVAILITFGVAFRLVCLLPYPQGIYNYRDSPNGRYRAIVYNLKEMEFFGKEKNFYQVRVEPAITNFPDQAVFRAEIPEALVPRGLDLSRSELVDKAIRWSPDSVTVKFTVGVKELESVVPF